MKNEPKILTPEEIAKIQNERTLSDAELINGGAGYTPSLHNDGTRFDLENKQIRELEKEMGESKQESPSIKLPKNPEVIKKLKNKLEEYKKRLEKIKNSEDYNNEYNSPEEAFKKTADVYYKIKILEEVLTYGEVKTYEFLSRFKKRDEQFNIEAFENACGVIKDYCDTGGANNIKGSLSDLSDNVK